MMQTHFTPVVFGVLALAAATGVASEFPATAPADPTVRLMDDVAAFQKVFKPEQLADAKARAAATDAVVPAAKKVMVDLTACADARPASAQAYRNGMVFYGTVLAVFGDDECRRFIDELATHPDPRIAMLGKTQQLYVGWCRSTEDAAAQAKVVDAVEALAKANPGSMTLTHQIVKMADQGAADPALAERLRKLVTGTMKNATAQQSAAKLGLPDRVGKPMTLAGQTVDGHAFSTADWKGKVVLVDFWAVWCGPCKKELPRVKALYDKYHAQGLEVLGVSNDYDAKSLTTYVAENAMPWPELYDAKAAAAEAFHPLAAGLGIDAIPCMILIDKAGVCRSVTARETMETLIPKLLAE